MLALIFNSGLGSRLGSLTADRPKSMVELGSGETIFHRQLRVLTACGIREFVVTTGPHPQMLEDTARAFEAQGCTFHFVNNPVYAKTNYIHSMWLARELLRDDDVLLLHGDLVFDPAYVEGMLALPAGSYGSVDPALPLPEKDFKARVADGEVREVGVSVWGDDCVAFQAMYRLSPEAMGIWLDEVDAFEARGETGVYAENAANQVFARMHVKAHPYTGHVLEEIDTPEDLARVSAMIRASDFAGQPVFGLDEDGHATLLEGAPVGELAAATNLPHIIAALGMERPLLVADGFFASRIDDLLGGALAGLPTFSGYSPNPTYDQVLDGIRTFRDSGCDSVVSLGGGSAIDVAKCIGLWAGLPGDGTGQDAAQPRFCDRAPTFSGIPHVAIPTTAGTGSESTHFAVVYVDGDKRSVATDSLQPTCAVLAPSLLAGLPAAQRRATMLDALCQAIESHWSVASSPASRAYSSRAITAIMGCWQAYLQGDGDAAARMHRAANLAGKAINLTTTTLAHAMSYKVTSLYGVPHGHAVALCMPFAWSTLLERGTERDKALLAEIDALVTGDASAPYGAGLASFEELYASLGLKTPSANDPQDIRLLAASVNPQRMGNYPIALSVDELAQAYAEILCRN